MVSLLAAITTVKAIEFFSTGFMLGVGVYSSVRNKK